jgi:hypothetical protein
MKHLLLIIGLAFTLNASAQQIDTVKNGILVKPVVLNYLQKDTLYQLTVDVFGLKLKDTTAGANTYISYFDRKAKKIGEKNVPLPAEVVNAWGTDDSSVVTYILQFLGLTKK